MSQPVLNSTLSNKPKTLDALTGLRFVAALAVVMIHSIEYSGGDVTECSAFATNAVAFFFVLSGFILTYVYHERLAQVGVVKFYFARFARIWPLHVVCVLVAIGVRTYYGQRDLGPDGVLATHLAMIQSWLPYEDWAMYLNGPAWSISTEFGFYFAFPVLLWLGRKRFWPLVLIFILALAMVGCLQLLVLQGQITDDWAVAMAYVNPLPRMAEFVLGVAIGKLFIARSKLGKMDRGPESVGGWIKDTAWELMAMGLLVVVFYVATAGVLHEFLLQQKWYVAASWTRESGGSILGFAATIWVFSWSRGFFGKLMSTPMAVYLGEISFALYLIQIPVLIALKLELGGLQLPMFYFLAIAIGLCLGLAMLLFAVVEMPCRQFLVSVVARDWSKAFAAVGSPFRRVCSGYVGVIALGLIGICIALVAYEKRHPNFAVPADKLLSTLDDIGGIKYSPVTFKDEAILHWWSVADEKDHFVVTMLWEVLEGQQRIRFVHICDEQESLLFNGPSNVKDFGGAAAGTLVVDHCKISKDQIREKAGLDQPGKKYVGVGFWAEGIDTAPADSGQLQMKNRRLLVAQLIADGIVKIEEK